MRQINGAYVPACAENVSYSVFRPRSNVLPALPSNPMWHCENVYVWRMPEENRGLIPAAAMCDSGWIINPAFKRYRLIVVPSPAIWGGAKFGGTAEIS